MGDTLQATSQPKSSGQIPDPKLRLQLPASNQPRKFDQLTETAGSSVRPSALKQADNSMRLEVGNYLNLSPHGLQPQTSRKNSSSFLFATPRQDLLSLLNTFPMAQNTLLGMRTPGFSSYYPSNRDFSSLSQGDSRSRLRGDSVCLPPPILTENQGNLASSNSSGQNQLRSTSIFSSLIQMPGSTGNSFSGLKPLAKDAPSLSKEGSLSLDYLQDYDAMNRDSLSNIFGWNQDAKMLGASNPSSKRNIKSFDNQNAFWEQFNTGATGSIAGISSDGLNAILSSMQSNPSIDLQSMNNEQRRDSILRYINDQGKAPKQVTKTPLREDIFEGLKSASAAHLDGRRASNVSHLSPTSSMSSKASHKIHEEPQSPKGSPGLVMGAPMSFVEPQITSPKKLSIGYTAPEQALNPNFSQQEKEQLMQYEQNMQSNLLPMQQHIQQQQMQQHLQRQQPQQPHGTPQQPNQALLYPFHNDEQLQLKNKNNFKGNFAQQYPTLLQQRQMLQQKQYFPRSTNGSYQGLAPMMNMGLANQPNGFQRDQALQKNALQKDAFQNSANVFHKNDLQKDTNGFQKGMQEAEGQFFPMLPNHVNTFENDRPLVPAQQYARAEDGRPLLGATKVDQLMLVIQAREKGNTGAIQQAPDGSIIAVPNANHDKNAVLPPSVDLVGGVEKDRKDEEDDGHDDKRRKRKAKTQECPYCFKKFNQSTHLDVHVRSHIGYKPFQCNYCQKRFTQGGNLRTHLRLHTGEKPFSCKVCNRSFSRKGNLAAHMLTHNKEKPFECKLDNCDKSFTQLGNLKSHQNKFHLPTLTKLTQTFSSITGDALDRLPKEERSMLDYFAGLYKNSNKGIRGRGKG